MSIEAKGRPSNQELSAGLLRRVRALQCRSEEVRTIWVDLESAMPELLKLSYPASHFWLMWARIAQTDDRGRGFIPAPKVLSLPPGDEAALGPELTAAQRRFLIETAEELQSAGFWHLEQERVFVFDRPDLIAFVDPDDSAAGVVR